MLRRRLFGFDVEVRPMFWVVSLLLGVNLMSSGAAYDILIWIAVVFGSILLHEIGHGLAFRSYGVPSHIVLHGMGGTAVGHLEAPLPRLANIVVSLAGPLIGMSVAAPLFAFQKLAPGVFFAMPRPLWIAAEFLVFASGTWGLFNLLPVLPLDGGHVLESVCGPRRVRLAAAISLVTAIGVGVLGFAFGQPMVALIMVGSVFESLGKFAGTRGVSFPAELARRVRAAAAARRARAKRTETERLVRDLDAADGEPSPPLPPEIEGILGRIVDEVGAEHQVKRERQRGRTR